MTKDYLEKNYEKKPNEQHLMSSLMVKKKLEKCCLK